MVASKRVLEFPVVGTPLAGDMIDLVRGVGAGANKRIDYSNLIAGLGGAGGIDASQIRGRTVSTDLPVSGDIYVWNATSSLWEPTNTSTLYLPGHGVTGDGVADDTAAMQAFLNARQDGDHVVIAPYTNIKNTGLTTPSGLQNFVMEGLGGAGNAVLGVPKFTYAGANGGTHIRWISNRGCTWRNILIDDRGAVSTDGPDKGIWFDQDASGDISSDNTLDRVIFDAPVRSGYRAVNIDNTSSSNNEQHKINIIVNGLGSYGTALGTGVYLGHTNVKEVVIEHSGFTGLAKGYQCFGNPSFYSLFNNFTHCEVGIYGAIGDSCLSMGDHSEEATQFVALTDFASGARLTIISPRHSALHGGQAASGTTSTAPIISTAGCPLEVKGGIFQPSNAFNSNFILNTTATGKIIWENNEVTGISDANLIAGLATFRYSEDDVRSGLAVRGTFSLPGANNVLSGATPDLSLGGSGVQYSTRYGFQNGGATSVTNFLNGFDGQIIYLKGDTVTTLANGANIKTSSGANIVPWTADKFVSLLNDGGVWKQTGGAV